VYRALQLVAVALTLSAGAAAFSARADDKPEVFVGAGLQGWEGLPENWSYSDGALVGTTYPSGNKFNTFLCSQKKYRDFELNFKIRLKNGVGNSGVQIRSEVFDRKHFAVKGPQADIGEVYWGCLYGEHFGGMMKEAPKAEVEKVLKKDDFNDYSIRCVGKHVTIRLNGVTTVDDDFAKMPDEGIIAWQLHAGAPMEVTFKNIEFRELDKKK